VGDVLRRGGWVELGESGREKSAGVASLRGQGTPAYPARLRSERARNSSEIFHSAGATNSSRIFSTAKPRKRSRMLPAADAEGLQEFLLPQGDKSVASSACGFFAAASDRAAVNQEAGGLPFPKFFTFFSRRRKNQFTPPRRLKLTCLLRREGIRSAQWRQPRRQRLLRAARCVARGRGSGHVQVRPK
jgi:hypothetical protein